MTIIKTIIKTEVITTTYEDMLHLHRRYDDSKHVDQGIKMEIQEVLTIVNKTHKIKTSHHYSSIKWLTIESTKY